MGDLPQDDKAMALSLVRKHLLSDQSQLSYVPSYTTVRWVGRSANAVQIGGHWRRKALCARSIAALQGTCKLQELHYEKDKTRSRLQQMPPNKTDAQIDKYRCVKRAFSHQGTKAGLQS